MNETFEDFINSKSQVYSISLARNRYYNRETKAICTIILHNLRLSFSFENEHTVVKLKPCLSVDWSIRPENYGTAFS